MQCPVARNEGKQDNPAAVCVRYEGGMRDYGKQHDHEPCEDISLKILASEQIDGRTYGIRPAYKSENAPPACLERLSVDVLIDHEESKQNHSCRFHGGEKELFRSFRFGIDSPDEEEAG